MIPESFEKLAYSQFQIGFLKNGDAAYNLFRNSKNDVYQTIFNKMEVLTGTGLDCYQNVLNKPRYACIAYDMATNFLVARNFSEANARKFVISQDITFNLFVG